MVVSEMGEQWSPNRLPLRTAAMTSGKSRPKLYAMLMPMGSRMAIVPQELPMAKEITAPMTNSRPGTSAGLRVPVVDSTMKVEVPSVPQTLPTPQATTMTARMEPIFWMPPTKISNACWKVISFCLTIMIRQVMAASR